MEDLILSTKLIPLFLHQVCIKCLHGLVSAKDRNIRMNNK